MIEFETTTRGHHLKYIKISSIRTIRKLLIKYAKVYEILGNKNLFILESAMLNQDAMVSTWSDFSNEYFN